jgi:hypothetical protein
MDGQGIYLWVCSKIGKLNESDINDLEAELRTPFTAHKKFQDELADFEHTATVLHDNQVPYSDLSLYMILLGKARDLPILLSVLQTFTDRGQEIDIRACYTYLHDNYVRRARAANEKTQVNNYVLAAIETAPKGQGRYDDKTKKRTRTDSRKTDAPRPEKFCWYHTHMGRQSSHVSADCKVMLNQPLRFSKEMRAATSYDKCPYKEV